jgi:cold shock CspA family protein
MKTRYSDVKATGYVKAYDPERGKGWIEPDHGGDELPFRRRDVIDEGGELRAGERVSYEVEGGMAGTVAIDVRRIIEPG